MYHHIHEGPHVHGDLRVESFTGGSFAENAYLVYVGKEALVIDPGHGAEVIEARVRALKLQARAVVNTHAHIDHVAEALPLMDLLGSPFWLHGEEAPVLKSVPFQASMFGLSTCPVPKIDRALAHGDVLKLGGLDVQVLHTPGHTPGGCCFYLPEAGVVFVGDTLFAGSIGRSDLPGGDHDTLIASIVEHLLPLADKTVGYSGHGPATTIGDERRTNPFLR